MNSKTITKFYLAIAFIFAVTDCAAQEPLKVITPTELNQAMQKEDIFLIGKIEIYKTLLKTNNHLKKAMIDEDSIKKLKGAIKKTHDPFIKWFLQALLYDSEKLFASPNYKDYLLQKNNNRFDGIELKKMDKKVQLLFRWIALATSDSLDSPDSPDFQASFKADLIPVMMDSLINIEASFFLMATNNIHETIQLLNSPKDLKFFTLKEIKIPKKKVIKEKTVEDILTPLTEPLTESHTEKSPPINNSFPMPSNEDWLNEDNPPLNLKNLPKPSDDADWLQDF